VAVVTSSIDGIYDGHPNKVDNMSALDVALQILFLLVWVGFNLMFFLNRQCFKNTNTDWNTVVKNVDTYGTVGGEVKEHNVVKCKSVGGVIGSSHSNYPGGQPPQMQQQGGMMMGGASNSNYAGGQPPQMQQQQQLQQPPPQQYPQTTRIL